MGQPNYLLRRLKRKGVSFENFEEISKCINILRSDLHSFRFFGKNGPLFVIHRKHWKKSGDVNWKEYIVEILKRRRVLPVVEFSYTPRKGKEVIVPPEILRFIEKFTRFSSFEETLKHIDEVEVFECGKQGKCMRLKHAVGHQYFPEITESRAEEQEVELSELKKLSKQNHLKTELRIQEQKEGQSDHKKWLEKLFKNESAESIFENTFGKHLKSQLIPKIEYKLDENAEEKCLGNLLDDDENPDSLQLEKSLKSKTKASSNSDGKRK
jgi:hypothetical protein